MVIAQAVGEAVFEGSHIVELPLPLPPGRQQPDPIHDDDVAQGRQVGRDVGLPHDAVERVQELGMELGVVGFLTWPHSTSP